jgi:S1-C subfamily serine protease
VRVGQGVTAVGNSGGAGRLITVRGRVVRLRKSITVEDETGKLRWLAGLIQTDAAVRPGDSGGPLFDGAGRVVGMNTAASYRYGYAIPVATATRVTQQIVNGKASARVHIGATAFFGVRVQGTTVVDVLPGSPAAAAGLKPGYVIISVAGRRVTGEAGITAAVLAHKPGELVTIVYRDDAGMRRSVRVRLKAGPPQ